MSIDDSSCLQSLKHLISDVMKQEFGDVLGPILLWWRAHIPARFRDVASPTHIKAGVLYVGTSHSAWNQELGFVREELLLMVQSSFPSMNIRNIKFYVKQ